MTHAHTHRIELSRGSPGTPSAVANLMVTGLFGLALAATFFMSWLWSTR
jgi:hypothetical protein